MNRLKKVAKNLIGKFVKEDYPKEDIMLCGVNLTVFKGSIRKQVDQDDAWFFQLAKHHNSIYDIGCNVGYNAILALIQNPNRPYLLVDPIPKALNIANHNIVYNNLGFKAQYLAALVTDTTGKQEKFFTVDTGAASSIFKSHAQTAADNDSYKIVNTITLNDIYKLYSIIPDLIKVDVEGAECLVLDGATKLAKELRCAFLIELHNSKEKSLIGKAEFCIAWCKNINYRVWYLKDAIELNDTSVLKGRGKCHVLLLPSDKAFPEYLKCVRQYNPLPKNIYL